MEMHQSRFAYINLVPLYSYIAMLKTALGLQLRFDSLSVLDRRNVSAVIAHSGNRPLLQQII